MSKHQSSRRGLTFLPSIVVRLRTRMTPDQTVRYSWADAPVGAAARDEQAVVKEGHFTRHEAARHPLSTLVLRHSFVI